jgi:hypothetical protein
MNITQELIEKIIAKHKPDEHGPLAKYVSKTITDINYIDVTMTAYKKQIINIEKEASKQIKEIQTLIVKLQNKCPHLLTQYYPDPSGGNDSSIECEICGAEL